jgi:hypothetical protein
VTFQSTIDSHPGNIQITGNRGLCCTSSDPSANFGVINVLLTPSLYTFGFCGVDPHPLPVLDELQFHVGDHTQDLVGNAEPTIVFVAQTTSAVIVLRASLRATAILLRMIFGPSAPGTI